MNQNESHNASGTYRVSYNMKGVLFLVAFFLLAIFFVVLGSTLPNYKVLVLGFFLLLTGFLSVIAVYSRIVMLVVREGVSNELALHKSNQREVNTHKQSNELFNTK